MSNSSSMAAADPGVLDANDPLAHHRSRYLIPDDLIYLDGNSLGIASHAALAALHAAAHDEWAQGLVSSWNTAGWFALPTTVGERIAPLVGAGAGQVVACDTVTLNLYKLLHAALGQQKGRTTVVAEAGSFPTDLYITEGVLSHFPNVSLKLEGRDGPSLEALIDDATAVVLINHVDYRTGVLRDMRALTQLAHKAGALVIWDLCHSAGAMPVELDACEVDFAVGCTYKYLNGGPGSPAFAYVAQRHQKQLRQPLSGWWGHARPFDFTTQYEAAPGVQSLLTGTQAILSFRTLAGALDDWADVDLHALRDKSLKLTRYFIDLVNERCNGFGLEVVTPFDDAIRGSQVSLRFEHAFPAVQALIAKGVVGDFRAPDIMRFGFTPLYLRFADVAAAVEHLHSILANKTWQDPRYSVRSAVT